jgi:hypothetical protein
MIKGRGRGDSLPGVNVGIAGFVLETVPDLRSQVFTGLAGDTWRR